MPPTAAQHVFRRNLSLPVSAAHVWTALTEASSLAGWLGDEVQLGTAAEGAFSVGGLSSLTPQGCEGRILEWQKGLGLAMRWPVEGLETTLSLRLEPRGEGCLLSLKHRVPLVDLEGSSGDAPHPDSLRAQLQGPTLAGSLLPAFWALGLSRLRRQVLGLPAPLGPRMDFSRARDSLVWLGATFPQPAAEVFALLATQDGLRSWLAAQAVVEAKEGGAWRLGWPARGPSKILAFKKNRLLICDWVDLTLAGETRVTFSLEAAQGTTRFELLHEGFQEGELTWPMRLLWTASLALLQDALEGLSPLRLTWEG